MFTSSDAIQVIGCSYRQLDHLTRCGVVPASGVSCPGPGGRRLWARWQVEALAVAHQLAAIGTGSGFPDIARAAMAAGPPPGAGYAMYDGTQVRWGQHFTEVWQLVDQRAPLVVIAYALADLPALPELADA